MPHRRRSARRAETTWELSYLDQVKSWLTLEPDLQFVNHPDADAALRNALVLQLRSEITF
jgi:porin